jgi:biopolymer transport protein ExbB
MEGAKALQRMKLERRLAYLATLGNNAPFIGLFGTVIGVVMAFDALGQQKLEAGSAQLAPQAVMSSIGEALVATAVGIGVAIPAVAANNVFQRITKATLANTEALSRVLLSHLKGSPITSAYRGVTAEVSTKEKKSEPAKKGKTESKSEPSSKSEESDDEEKA